MLECWAMIRGAARQAQREKTPAWWRRLYERIVRLDGTPERIAGGMAVGVVMGVGPTLGIGLPAAAGLAALLRLNVAAAVMGVLTGIPPLLPLTWGASCYIGGLVLGVKWEFLYQSIRAGRILEAGGDMLFAYLVGNIILTAILAAAAYMGTSWIVRRNRRAARSER